MADNIRDRVLVLRILPPHLLDTLKQKISDKEEEAATSAAKAAAESTAANAQYNSERAAMGMGMLSNAPSTSVEKEGQITDLDGVICEPAEDGSTLWKFQCDNDVYPARLVNLPCPLEVMKTHDHAMFYKCSDVGQILVVYENMAALEEAEGLKDYKVDDFPSYFHSGLSPPMKRVVQRRFKAREHKSAPYEKDEVMEVMVVLRDLISQIRPDTAKTKKSAKAGVSAATQDTGKEIVEIEDVEVPFEPWMTNNGKFPKGIEFDETDALCYKHPELWLGLGEGIVEQETEKKKKGKSSKKKGLDTCMGYSDKPTSSHKKGIPSKKNREDDSVTQAALGMKDNNNTEDLYALLDGGDDFNFEEDVIFGVDQNT